MFGGKYKNAKIRMFYINSDVNSSANDRGAIFVIMHADERFN